MSFSLLGLIQRSPFKVALRIPRIKLPKLALPALLVYSAPKIGYPSVTGIIGKVSSLAGGLLNSLSPFQQKLSSMFTSIGNLTPGSALGYAKGVISSAAGEIGKLATGLINNAIAGATAAVNSAIGLVNGAISTVVGLEQSVVSEIQKVSQLFKTQVKSVEDLLKKEIDVSSGNTQTIAQVSAVQASITNTIVQSTTNLTNNTIKKLQEDPEFNTEFTANVTQQAINAAAQAVVVKNTSINNAAMQSATVTNLGKAPIAPPLIVNTLTPSAPTTTNELIGGEVWSLGTSLSINQLITIRNDIGESSYAGTYSQAVINQYNKQLAAGQVPTQ